MNHPLGHLRSSKILADLPRLFVDEYLGYSRRLIEEDWDCHLLTFLFKPLPENREICEQLMGLEIYRVYKKALMWSVKYPRAAANVGRLPVWICCPDWSVPKGEQVDGGRRELFKPNGGLHYGGLAFHPPRCRLRLNQGGLEGHLGTRISAYLLPGKPLSLMDARRVKGDPQAAVEYTFKSILRGRSQIHEILKFPLASSELGVSPRDL